MRPRYKIPLNKRYFHSKPKIDNKDISVVKKRIEHIKQEKLKKEIEKNR